MSLKPWMIVAAAGLVALAGGTLIALFTHRIENSATVNHDQNNVCIPLPNGKGIQTNISSNEYEYSINRNRGAIEFNRKDGEPIFLFHYVGGQEMANIDPSTKKNLIESLKARPELKTADGYSIYKNTSTDSLFNQQLAEYEPFFLSNSTLITDPETNKEFFYLDFFADPTDHQFLKDLLRESRIQPCKEPVPKTVPAAATPINASNNLCIPFSKKLGVQTTLPNAEYSYTVGESDYGQFYIKNNGVEKFSFLSIPAQWDMAGFKKSYKFDTRKPAFKTADGYSVRDPFDGEISDNISAYVLSNEDLLDSPYETNKKFFVLSFSSSQGDRSNPAFLRALMPGITITQCAEPYNPEAHTPSALQAHIIDTWVQSLPPHITVFISDAQKVREAEFNDPNITETSFYAYRQCVNYLLSEAVKQSDTAGMSLRKVIPKSGSEPNWSEEDLLNLYLGQQQQEKYGLHALNVADQRISRPDYKRMDLASKAACETLKTDPKIHFEFSSIK